ncbi:hypothetical protein BKA56DRAFT_657280 [Ilyonectria sp. MPI-CAGE-AT-0026]|nr:hypothetical protein BKA56DRAFT_657280 [Ilyonectria sp. MPI-CAGE-AT-0026]
MGLPISSSSTTSQPADTTPQQQSQSTPAAAVATGAGANSGAGVTRPKTEAEKEADRLYEERMEEEYAKRDGGAPSPKREIHLSTPIWSDIDWIPHILMSFSLSVHHDE